MLKKLPKSRTTPCQQAYDCFVLLFRGRSTRSAKAKQARESKSRERARSPSSRNSKRVLHVVARWNFDQQFPDTVQAKETQETKPTQQTLQLQSATTQSRWTFQSAKDPGRQRRLWLETEKGLIANPVDPFRMTLTLGRRPAHEWPVASVTGPDIDEQSTRRAAQEVVSLRALDNELVRDRGLTTTADPVSPSGLTAGLHARETWQRLQSAIKIRMAACC